MEVTPEFSVGAGFFDTQFHDAFSFDRSYKTMHDKSKILFVQSSSMVVDNPNKNFVWIHLVFSAKI